MENAVNIVQGYLDTALHTDTTKLSSALDAYLAPDAVFHCGSPIGDIQGAKAITDKLWHPLKNAFTHMKSIPHVALDGVCAVDGKQWVSVTGIYTGNFTNNLYTIPATKVYTGLRYGEFYCVENNQITEAYILFDYIQLMNTAGVRVLPEHIGGCSDVQPPASADGMGWHTPRDDQQSEKTFATVMCMLAELLVDKTTNAGEQKSYWAENMTWYGPSGIGTYHTLDGFKHYRNAFLNTFPNRDYGNHNGVIAKNNYMSVVGWKGVHATHQGSGWLGLAPTGKDIVMPLMDFWRVNPATDMIEENWVLIDIVNIFEQLGVDLFANIARVYGKDYFPVPETVKNTAITDPVDAQFKDFLVATYKKYNG